MENKISISERLASAAEDLFHVLGLDMDDYTISNGAIRGPACCHGGDNKTAFTYYYLSGTWACWTHGCHREHGYSLIGLIMAIKKCTTFEAVTFANNFLAGKDVQINVAHRKIARKIKQVDEWQEHLNQPEQIEKMKTQSAFAYSQIRNLDYRLFEEFDIMYVKDGPLRMRIVVPVKNINDKVVGFTGRKTYDTLPGPKWLHYKLNTRNNLLNIKGAIKAAEKKKYVILCEGPWDVLKFKMAGYNNVVAIFGLSVCNGHIKILNKCGISKVCLALDNDIPGRKAMLMNARKLDRHLFDVHMVRAKKDSDFGKMEVKDIKKAVKKSGV